MSAPAVRMASNGTQGYVVMARAGTNEVRLYRIASGLIFLDSQSLATSPEGKTQRLEASGSTLTIKVDGTSVLTYTDSTYLGAGDRNVGLVSNGHGRRARVDEASTKVPLTVVQGSTENKAVCARRLNSLEERGFDPARGVARDRRWQGHLPRHHQQVGRRRL